LHILGEPWACRIFATSESPSRVHSASGARFTVKVDGIQIVLRNIVGIVRVSDVLCRGPPAIPRRFLCHRGGGVYCVFTLALFQKLATWAGQPDIQVWSLDLPCVESCKRSQEGQNASTRIADAPDICGHCFPAVRRTMFYLSQLPAHRRLDLGAILVVICDCRPAAAGISGAID